MQNNVIFHVTSGAKWSKAKIVIAGQKYTVKCDESVPFTFPVGVTEVAIKPIKGYLQAMTGNKTYHRQIYIKSENSVVDVHISIGRAVVKINIYDRV